jgi:hypothetical protein
VYRATADSPRSLRRKATFGSRSACICLTASESSVIDPLLGNATNLAGSDIFRLHNHHNGSREKCMHAALKSLLSHIRQRWSEAGRLGSSVSQWRCQ